MPLIPWQLHQTPIGPSMAPGVIAVLCEVDATNKGHGAVEDDGFDVRQIEDLGIKFGFPRDQTGVFKVGFTRRSLFFWDFWTPKRWGPLETENDGTRGFYQETWGISWDFRINLWGTRWVSEEELWFSSNFDMKTWGNSVRLSVPRKYVLCSIVFGVYTYK